MALPVLPAQLDLKACKVVWDHKESPEQREFLAPRESQEQLVPLEGKVLKERVVRKVPRERVVRKVPRELPGLMELDRAEREQG
jgi:hypothetical protein